MLTDADGGLGGRAVRQKGLVDCHTPLSKLTCQDRTETDRVLL